MRTLMLVLLLVGCAAPVPAAKEPERYLSAEEDAEIKKNCEPVGGCVIVPVPIWKKIEEFIGRSTI